MRAHLSASARTCRHPRDLRATIHHSRAPASYRHLMASKQAKDTRVATAIRVPKDLHTELQKQADARDVSVNFLIVRAINDFLDRLPTPEQLQESLRAS